MCALQYSQPDDRLTLDDWKSFKAMKLPWNPTPFGAEMAQRIISDDIELFSQTANRGWGMKPI